MEEQKKSIKEKKNEKLVKVNNKLQTITVQCSLLEDTVKKIDGHHFLK